MISLQGAGNAVMATPTIRALAGAGHEVHVVVRSCSVGELLTPVPWIRSVSWLEGHLGGLVATGLRLRRERFNRSVTCYPNGSKAALLAMIAGADVRTGFIDALPAWLTRAYNVPLNIEPDLHDVVQNSRLLTALGLSRPSELAPGVVLTQADREFAGGLLSAAGFGVDRPVAAVHPGCAPHGMFRRWPLSSYSELVRRMSEELGLRVVLVGDHGERPMLEEIAREGGPHVVIAAGGASLRQLAAVIERCRVFVGNDSGPLHIAAALGVPSVGIFGPTDSGRTGPFGDRHVVVAHDISCRPCYAFGRRFSCEHSTVRCLESLSVDSVFDAVSAGIAGGN